MAQGDNVIDLELYLIRHGQTWGNVGKMPERETELDRLDVDLTPDGYKMARLLGERFASYPFDAVYASWLRRAVVTANELVTRQPADGAREISLHPIFTECGAGDDFEGLPLDVIRTFAPSAKPADGVDPEKSRVFPTRGWTDAQQLERAKEALAYLRSRHHGGQKIAVVAHAAFNTFLFHAALGLDPEKVSFDPHFINTGVTKLVFFEPGTGRYGLDTLLVYSNDLSHLQRDYPELALYPTYI